MDNNQAVFTTKHVIDNNSVITYVIHDGEGDWQFFGSEKDVDEKDARIVSLDEILEIDPSIKEILWIPEGTDAWRASKNSTWTTGVYSSK